MLTPLWTPGRRDIAGREVPLSPVRFGAMGRGFLYEPSDMRLFTGSGAELTEAIESADGKTTVAPDFALRKPDPAMLVLTVTKACTLRCRYCFAAPGSSPVMEIGTAEKALELIPGERDFTAGFFGGEPLIGFDFIKQAVELAKRKAAGSGVRARFCVTTNCTLLDGDKARFFDAENFSIVASLDGPRHLHDASRPTVAGGGSYDLVIKGLREISKFPELARRTTLRATFDGALGQAHLLERLRHLNHVAREFGFGNVSVEPADISEGCARPGGAKKVLPSPELYGEYMAAAEWFADEEEAGRDPKFHHFAVRVARLVTRRPSPSECGAGVGYVAADVDGTLHACHRLGDSQIGAAGKIDPEKQAVWLDNRYTAREKCPECWLRNVCGGGCRLNSISICGNIRKPDPLGCWLTETCVKAAAYILSRRASASSRLPTMTALITQC